MNNRTLLVIFLLLLGVYGATKLFSRKGSSDRSFKTELIQIDTANVTSIVLQPKTDDFAEIILKKEGTQWLATQGNVTTKATSNAILSLLRTLTLIKTERVAAKSKEKWNEYEVAEGQGSRVKVYDGSTLLEDFIVGRFAPNQQMQNGTSFVRLSSEDEVYAVQGFLSFTFNQGFNSFRDRGLLQLTPADITYFSFSSPDGTAININKTNGQWFYETTPLDSTKVANYLSNISNTSGNEFADDFDELQSTHLLNNTLTISGNNITSPIIIKSYATDNEELPYVIQSSQNTDALFRSKLDGVYEKLFKTVIDFTN